MLFDKEYPATHSMSTAWYIVDEDGNVGIMQYNLNGPVPITAEPDECFEPINYMIFDGKKNIPIKLTEEQIFEMIECEDFDLVDDYCDLSLYKIDSNKKDIFLNAFKNTQTDIFCISQELSLYYIDTLEMISYYLQKLVNEGVILSKYKMREHQITEVYNMFSEPDIKKNFENCPFYVYYQFEDSKENPEQRINIPKNPVKITQFPESLRNKLLKLPFKFSQTLKFRIDQYTDCKHDSSLDYY